MEFTEPDSPSRPDVFLMSLQPSITRPEDVDSIKQSIVAGTFDFKELNNRIGGYYQPRNKIFYVAEGNHRLAAALEIAKETGNWSPAKKLLQNGNWDETQGAPQQYFKINVRKTLWDSIGWRKFLSPVTPTSGAINERY